MRLRRQAPGPERDQPCQLARFPVVASERTIGREPGRTEEDDGVAHVLTAEPPQGPDVFRDDAQRASLIAGEELLVLVGNLDARWGFRWHHESPKAGLCGWRGNIG